MVATECNLLDDLLFQASEDLPFAFSDPTLK